jgi:microcystin-dependent protein
VKRTRRFSIAHLLTLLAAFALVGTMFTGLGVASAAENNAVPGVQALLFNIVPGHSPSKCLESAGGTVAVTISTCDVPASGAQLWEVVDTSQSGVVKLVKQGQCLEVAGAGTANGTPLRMATCNGQTNQTFVPTFVSANFYRIRAGHSLGKCLDVKNDVPAEGAPLQLWECLGTGQTNQHFKFVSA